MLTDGWDDAGFNFIKSELQKLPDTAYKRSFIYKSHLLFTMKIRRNGMDSFWLQLISRGSLQSALLSFSCRVTGVLLNLLLSKEGRTNLLLSWLGTDAFERAVANSKALHMVQRNFAAVLVLREFPNFGAKWRLSGSSRSCVHRWVEAFVSFCPTLESKRHRVHAPREALHQEQERVLIEIKPIIAWICIKLRV